MKNRPLHSVAKTLREDPRFRRIAIPTYRRVTRMMVFGKGPRVLINSIPKAGTHVLSTLVRQLPGVIHSGQHYVFDDFRATEEKPPIWGDMAEVEWNRLERCFSSFNRGQFMTSHFPADARLMAILQELGYKVLVIVRDPRDVVVSSALYITRLKRHVMHESYTRRFSIDDDGIMGTIMGFPADQNGRGAESMGQKIERYLPWLGAPGVHSCRFEKIIGPAGGGGREDQLMEIEGIVRYLGFDLVDQQLENLARNIWSQGSPTFRKGHIGDWKNHFTESHKAAFKQVAGEHLIRLGYEHDFNW